MYVDFSDLLNVKKIVIDEDVWFKILSIGVMIFDIFMEKVCCGEDIYQFYLYFFFQEMGCEFIFIDWMKEYQVLVDNFNICKKCVLVWWFLEDIVVMQGESGYFYLLFEGNVNCVNLILNVGMIKMSNFCLEILQFIMLSYFYFYG